MTTTLRDAAILLHIFIFRILKYIYTSSSEKPRSEDKIARIASGAYVKGGGYMPDPPNITTAEIAKKIMGDNMIELKEVISVFPSLAEDVADYETVPFSTELLYFCSEPRTQYVLVPGLLNFGKNSDPLTAHKLKNIFCKKFPNLFAPTKELQNPKNVFMDNVTCKPQWYLLSKEILDEARIERFCQHREINQKDSWAKEPAVVYIYSWLVFRLLRNEEIFQPNEKFLETRLACIDVFSEITKSEIYLEFQNSQIHVGSWRKNPKEPSIGIVPSWKHHII